MKSIDKCLIHIMKKNRYNHNGIESVMVEGKWLRGFGGGVQLNSTSMFCSILNLTPAAVSMLLMLSAMWLRSCDFEYVLM